MPECGMDTFNIAIQNKFKSHTTVGRILLAPISDTKLNSGTLPGQLIAQ
jgi:hypothetical protein